MKKAFLILFTVLSLSFTTLATENVNVLHEEVKEGYKVGYTIDNSCVLGSDFHMWSLGDVELVKDNYVAYSLEDDSYYYITQECAQDYFSSDAK